MIRDELLGRCDRDLDYEVGEDDAVASRKKITAVSSRWWNWMQSLEIVHSLFNNQIQSVVNAMMV